jgi:hypothetical protein
MLVEPTHFRIKRELGTPWYIEVYDRTGRAIGLHVDRNANSVRGFETAEGADLYAREVLKLERLVRQ